MCIDVNVSLPTVNKFLLLYSLRAGCVVILLWTAIRTLACCLFVIFAIPEEFLGGKSSFKDYPMLVKVSDPPSEMKFYVYAVFVLFLLTEVTLLAYSVYNLTAGIYDQKAEPIRQFVVCRFFTWLIELAVLFILCLIHGKLIGWYLIMLMVIILEFYGFVIVYSYYRELLEEEFTCERKQWNDREDNTVC